MIYFSRGGDMLEQSSIISIVSAVCSAGTVIYATVKVNSNSIKNIEFSLSEFKKDIKSDIAEQKKSAMDLADRRFRPIEDNIREIFPRLRRTEDKTNENGMCIDFIKKSCVAHRGE